MSGNISRNNGISEVMVVGEPAWHRLGTVLDGPATAEQAIKAAHLDWTVSKRPILVGGEGLGERRCRVADLNAVVRDDEWSLKKAAVLGYAFEDHKPLQNRDAFDFFDPIVGENAAVYHTAGALGDGERVWILAKLPGNICLPGDDITEKFLLLSNTHGGDGGVAIKFTPIRVVCQNTLTLAMQEGTSLHIANAKDMKERLAIAAGIVNAVTARYRDVEEVFGEMANLKLGRRELQWYLSQVFPDPNRADFDDDDSYERALKWARADRSGAEYFFHEGKGNGVKGVAGTLWAAYNGVAEYVDYRKYSGKSADRRLHAIWFGRGCAIKEHSYKLAVAGLFAMKRGSPSFFHEALRNAC